MLLTALDKYKLFLDEEWAQYRHDADASDYYKRQLEAATQLQKKLWESKT